MHYLTEQNVLIANKAINRYLADYVTKEMSADEILGEAYDAAFNALVKAGCPMGNASLVAQKVVSDTFKENGDEREVVKLEDL